jgi:UDP-N-acetylmuramoylalanine--D-glutamate ligase
MSPPYRAALVIGLGQSGMAAVRLLVALGVPTRGYDRRAHIDGLPDDVDTFLGSETPPDEAYAGLDLLVLSPGVPPDPFLSACRRLAPRARIHGELSLALEQVPRPGPSLVLITGTNGKSTVTALTGALLRAAGHEVFVGGNLGDPVADRVRAGLQGTAPWPAFMVLECSSYQLETLPRVETAVAMITNVTPDHLDRYATLEDYARTKARVFHGLDRGGLAILDAACPWTPRLRPRGEGLRVLEVEHPRGPHVDGPGSGRALVVPGDPPYPRSALRLPGRHNAKNALFAVGAARHLGVSPAACLEGLAGFEGLPHRMRLVRELDGVRYYDDSKATNVASAVAGLSGLDEPFVLIAGGRGKGDDLTPLAELLHTRGRGLVAIGETREAFHALARPPMPAAMADDMTGAVAMARAMARVGDAVVLAPACASFDQYRSYAHRGEVFIAAVERLV